MQIIDYKLEFLFSDLRNFKIVDIDNRELGVPNDVLLSLKDFSINSLILGKGYNKYFIPIPKIKAIDLKSKKIILKESGDEIKNNGKYYTAPEETITYLKLKELPVYSKSNEKIGKIVDIFYPSEEPCQFIIAGSELRELLEKLKIITNLDLLVPEHLISHLSDKIQLNADKNDLITSLSKSLRNPKEKIKKDFIQFSTISDYRTLTYSKVR